MINIDMDPFTKALAEFLGIEIDSDDDLEDVGIQSMNPNSEAIQDAYYDVDNKTLIITFTSGSTYQYEDVSPQRWRAFQNAASAGKYFVYRIRENYSYSKGVI